jgi:hypothetical protein
MKKIVPAPKPVPKTTKVQDVALANAVKVGVHQLMYMSAPTYEMELQGNVISFRHKSWGPDDKTVYSTLFNVIFWRE